MTSIIWDRKNAGLTSIPLSGVFDLRNLLEKAARNPLSQTETDQIQN